MTLRRIATLLVATGLTLGCGGDDDGATSSGGGSGGGTAASASGETSDEDLPICDPATTPADGLCDRLCQQYDDCGESFAACMDMPCCLDQCRNARDSFYDATAVCGDRQAVGFECVAGLACEDLADVSMSTCAAAVDAGGECRCREA